METFWILLYIFIILIIFPLFLILFIPSKVGLVYARRHKMEEVKIRFGPLNGAFFIPAARIDLAKSDSGELIEKINTQDKSDAEEISEDAETLLKRYKNLATIVFSLIEGKIPFDKLGIVRGLSALITKRSLGRPGYQCEYMHIRTRVGLGEPALSAVAVGTLWAVVAATSQKLRQTLRLKKDEPVWDIIPEFYSVAFDADLNCIFRINLGYIILRELFETLKIGSPVKKPHA